MKIIGSSLLLVKVWLRLLLSVCLLCFVSNQLALAVQVPLLLQHSSHVLNFDDITTKDGFGKIPTNYSFLDFEGFSAFKPSDPKLDGLISPHDLGCATSSPNALYGTRYNFKDGMGLPCISVSTVKNGSSGELRSFELQSLKIKPLDMPFEYTKLSLRGHQVNDSILKWDVDFPAGFHEMLKVDIEPFSQSKWDNLTKLAVWADFYNGGSVMDWEFCLDDLEIKYDLGHVQ